MRKHFLCLAALGLIATACSQQERECNEGAKHCSLDGTAVVECVGGFWSQTSCDADKNMVCASVNDDVFCMNMSAPHINAKCPHGATSCHENGMVRYCLEDGSYVYMTCPAGQSCHGGKCTGETVVHEGWVRRECGADGRSVVWVDANGERTTVSCRDEVGFDGRCEDFGAGNAGCVMPESCNEDFTDRGVCAGNQRILCDSAKHIIPTPVKEDCAGQGKICVMEGNDDFGYSAFCDDTCSASDSAEFQCVHDDVFEYIARCRHVGDQYDYQKRMTLCADDATVASCVDGAVVTKACGAGETCVDGACIETCTAADEGKFHCTETQTMVVCQKMGNRYGYQSVGMSICEGSVLHECSREAENASVTQKDTDCTDYISGGTRKQGICTLVTDFVSKRYACIPGKACGNVTEAGRCKGNVLQYCDANYHIVGTEDCSQHQKANKCSVYKGIADCRKSCTKLGEATCTLMDAASNSYLLELCVPDDETGALVIESGENICLDGVLHTCVDGKPHQRDCALSGGRCDMGGCAFPACPIDTTPVCFADGAFTHCEWNFASHMIGMALETLICDDDGTCYSCQNGKIAPQ